MHYPWHRDEHDDELRRTSSHLTDDGRLNISFHRHFLRDREHSYNTIVDDEGNRRERKTERKTIKSSKLDFKSPIPDDLKKIPKMNVAVLITGSRGDVQPFIALGQTLQAPPYNHRVRICTHPVFKDFVEENGLEFFSIGGDPSLLMSYVVKNPGIIPSYESFKAGDIGARKAEIAEMMDGAWRACTEAGDGITQIDLEQFLHSDDVLLSCPPPFVADAIISNPPTYANIHIAERLGIPCHIMFTMPWSPTRAFPHPLTNVDASKIDNAGVANLLSYKRMELLTWEGLSDIINHFREKTLHLDAVSPLWGHKLFPRLNVPFTYCWSEALIPKPADWGPHISISGFFFLKLGGSYEPDPELKAFLDAGPPPVYIGFGSIVVDDPERLTNMVFEAVKKAGVRALVSKGWGGVGGTHPPENVFLLGNVPHDWLFPRVSAVVHHGGAGTTAIGIALGKPTVVVPFFGDQPFWGNMVYKAGAGPVPTPFKDMTSQILAESIQFALQPEVLGRAHELAEKIKGEEGPKNAAEFFQKTPQMSNVGCFLCPDRVAVWRIRRTNIKLSSLAVAVLVTRGKLNPQHIKLVRHKRWYVEEGSQDPIVAVLGALSGTATGLINDVVDWTHGMTGRVEKSVRTPVRSSMESLEKRNHDSARSSVSDKDLEKGITGLPKRSNTTASCRSERKSRHKRMMSASCDFVESSAIHVAKFPIALAYNLANGFHNAPAQFGDTTVRINDPINGLWSGIKVGGKEFAFSTYDAFAGFVIQPQIGYREGKGHTGGPALGIIKGVGLSFTGFVFKLPAAFIGPVGYGTKGMEREIKRWWTGSDSLRGDEVAVILKAKEEVREIGFGAEEDTHAAQLIWSHAKGAGVGKRIVERRVWQGYREIREMRQKEGVEGAKKIEDEILQRWEKMEVDEQFLCRLMASSGHDGYGNSSA